MQIPPIPKDFIDLTQPLFESKKDFLGFLESLKLPAKRACRYNPSKILPKIQSQVPWAKDAEYVDTEKNYKNDPLWHIGGIYSQEPSSMIVGDVLAKLQPKKVLDLCASPGGKTTLALSRLDPNKLVVANEVVTKRVHTLIENVQKWGNTNVIVTQNQAQDFARLGEFFDFVLIDAPCSGEGLARKDPFLWNHWSLEMVKKDALRQREILENILPAVEIGGYVLYSTCTFNKIENEDIIQNLLQDYPQLEAVDLDFVKDWNILNTQKGCYKMLPNNLEGEGFSFAILRKKETIQSKFPQQSKLHKIDLVFKELSKSELKTVGEFVQNPDKFFFYKKTNQIFAINKIFKEEVLNFLQLQFRVHLYDFKVGSLGQKEFVPEHAILLNLEQNKSIPTIDIDLEKALDIIKGKPLQTGDFAVENSHKKSPWIVLTYQKVPLGWAKIQDDKIKNFYPKELRIQ